MPAALLVEVSDSSLFVVQMTTVLCKSIYLENETIPCPTLSCDMK